MSKAEKLITENLDVWTSAFKTKSTTGRGRGKKQKFYGIKMMRELILDLAVRGLLVSQNDDEIPASDAVAEVRLELVKAFKEGKIKKQQLPKSTKVKPDSERPIGWTSATLPEVVRAVPNSIKRGPFGSSIKKDMFVSRGYKVYEQQHAIYGDFDAGTYYLSLEDFEKLRAFELSPSDVIISCSGTVGCVSIAPKNLEPGVINQALLKLSLHQRALLNEYFKILFPAYFMRLETLTDLKGTAQKNMPGMNVMKSFVFPLPPLAEQHRIVAKVDELMALCDQLEQEQENSLETHDTLVRTLLDALVSSTANASAFTEAWQRIASNFDTLFTTDSSIDALKQTILQLAVMGKLVPQDPEDEPAEELLKRITVEKAKLVKEGKIKKQKKLTPVTEDELPHSIPDSWLWVRLQNVTNLITDGKHGDCLNLQNSGYYFLSAKDIQNSELLYKNARQIVRDEFEEVHRRTDLEPLDICLVNTGATVGKLAIAKDNMHTARTTFQKSVAVIKPSKPHITSEYLAFFLLSETPKLRRKSGGSAINNLLLGDLKKKVFPLPPLAEQHRIVAKVDELMAICDQLKTNLATAQETQLNLADSLVEQAIG